MSSSFVYDDDEELASSSSAFDIGDSVGGGFVDSSDDDSRLTALSPGRPSFLMRSARFASSWAGADDLAVDSVSALR